VFCYLARELTNVSLKKIALFLNKNCHASVLRSQKVIVNELSIYKSLQIEVDKIVFNLISNSSKNKKLNLYFWLNYKNLEVVL
jgi:hypothetical protein